MHKHWTGLPVVLMTGWSEGAGHGGEGLFAAQLAKPPSLDTLQQALDAAILALDLPAHAPVALEP